MWPWEHLAVGYIIYSLLGRLRWLQRPDAATTVAVSVGTQFPDLVDKPLAWILRALPAGQSLAHSLLVAVPVCVTVLLLFRRWGQSPAGLAFVVGYLSHLPADVVYRWLVRGDLEAAFLLWPLFRVEPALPADPLTYVQILFGVFVGFITTTRGLFYLAGELLLLLTALFLWARDGYPLVKRLRAVQ
jgi:membrane-bound metal-dependent hydrolase YbcI (DUF457 family)